MNLIDACIDKGVKRIVALSTDKASSPVNLYGATKLASDNFKDASEDLKKNRLEANLEKDFLILEVGENKEF